jgi:formylglycine-generating enzyme required for sulfatase activity
MRLEHAALVGGSPGAQGERRKCNPMRRSLLRSIVVAGLLALAWTGSGHAETQKDREFQECRDCPIMVGIPAGTFLMGSPAKEAGHFDSEGPQHDVAIKAFALGKYDVTSDQFLAFLKATGYQPKPCNPLLNMGWESLGHDRAYAPYHGDMPRWPAVCLDWHDAEKYVDWLNAKVREERPATARASGPYRLPTEAEWEYAARAGTKTARWWGDAIGTGNANCNGCGSPWDNRLFADVDSFKPNPFGLYGVLGNAWQWTADCWHPSYVHAPQDGSAWIEGDCSKHVIRGGSWHNLPVFVRSAARIGSGGDIIDSDYSGLAGFRVARDLP